MSYKKYTPYPMHFSPQCPITSVLNDNKIKELAFSMQALVRNVTDIYLPVYVAERMPSINQQVESILSQLNDIEGEIKQLPRMPSKKVRTQKAQRAEIKRKKNRLIARRAECLHKLKWARQDAKLPAQKSAAYHWVSVMEQIIKAIYKDRGEDQGYMPHYDEVYEAYVAMMKELTQAGNDSLTAEWNEAFSEHHTVLEGLSDYPAYLKAAIVLVSLKGHLRQYPHNISFDQLTANLCDDEGINVPQGSMSFSSQLISILNKKTSEATDCTQLSSWKVIEIQHVDEVLSDLEGGMINAIVQAPMGGVYNADVHGKIHNSGSKTGGIMVPLNIRAIRNREKVVNINHRVSLSHELHDRIAREVKAQISGNSYKFVHHYRREGALPSTDALVTCVNSIAKDNISQFVTQASTIVIDEYSQVQDNYSLIESSDKKGAASEAKLREAMGIHDLLMKKATDPSTTVVMMDADFEDGLLDPFLNAPAIAAQTVVYKITHPECTLAPADRSKQAVFYRNKHSNRQCQAKVIQCCDNRMDAKLRGESGGRFFIAADSIAQTYTYQGICLAKSMKVCLINSDTSQIKGTDAWNLINNVVSPEHFDVVIISPAITSGCSWLSEDYQTGVVIGCGVIPSYNLKQMAFRFRNTKVIHVFQGSRMQGEIYTDSFDQELAKSIEGDFEYGSSYVAMRQHREELAEKATKNQLPFLYWQLEAEGWGCRTYDYTYRSPSAVQPEFEGNERARVELIQKAKSLSAVAYTHIAKELCSHDEQLEVYKFQAEIYTAVSTKQQDVSLALSTANKQATKQLNRFIEGNLDAPHTSLLDTMMSQIVPGWFTKLGHGEELKITADQAQSAFYEMIEDDIARDKLILNGHFTERWWIDSPPKKPISKAAVVITCDKHKIHIGPDGTLDLATMPIHAIQRAVDQERYRAFPTFRHSSKAVLLVDIKPARKRFGLEVLRKLLNQSGIINSTDRGVMTIGDQNTVMLIQMARRQRMRNTLLAQCNKPQEHLSFGTIKLECWPEGTSSGCTITVFNDGSGFKVEGTDDFILDLLKSETLALKLARASVEVEAATKSLCLEIDKLQQHKGQKCNVKSATQPSTGKASSVCRNTVTAKDTMYYSTLSSIGTNNGDSNATFIIEKQPLIRVSRDQKTYLPPEYLDSPTPQLIANCLLAVLATTPERIAAFTAGISVKPDEQIQALMKAVSKLINTNSVLAN